MGASHVPFLQVIPSLQRLLQIGAEPDVSQTSQGLQPGSHLATFGATHLPLSQVVPALQTLLHRGLLPDVSHISQSPHAGEHEAFSSATHLLSWHLRPVVQLSWQTGFSPDVLQDWHGPHAGSHFFVVLEHPITNAVNTVPTTPTQNHLIVDLLFDEACHKTVLSRERTMWLVAKGVPG